MRHWWVVVMLAVSACAGPTATSQPDPATTTSQTPSADALPVALDWSVARLGGGQIDGGDMAGSDVVLWFWAPW